MTIIHPLILGYLLGSIPFGLVITKAAGLGDIRTVGSGNIGATNVLRTGRKDLALATLLLDGGKGAIAVVIAMLMGWRPEVAGAAAFLGHCFPVWLSFKGGKGVATFMGTLFALNFTAGFFAGAIWLGVAYLLKFSSLAALIAAAATPFILFALGKPSFALAALVMALLIIIRHKANITRLLSGDEPRIGAKKAEAANDHQSVQPNA
ncbi:glycerol-3-phosphate 1-O-acyltransferase PlsY [Hyphococcus sp.]|uniref:glycerol-3-phosphate 1-O-acyltransferase PlsY n=1 Tax=Hyphococcus sp. TaxID=2038636 RepID=UPI00208C51CE|nr:MAG: glycerol-3-phosphate acyltransferase [Marinicaulis sp.]